MKLRIHGDSLRLRLSQSDIARLGESGSVKESIAFPNHELNYSIETGAVENVRASFEGCEIRVVVPRAQARHWIESDETGIEASSGALCVLIEKDFKCLHRESVEDSDSFPNPDAF